MTDTGVPYYPQTLDQDTVIGRLSAGAGPSEQITITDLADALGDAVIQAAEEQAAALSGTSTTSLLIEVATKVFTTQANKQFDGQFCIAYSDADETDWMFGQCTYTGTTLTMTVDAVGGSGTLADWIIKVCGARGAVGPAGDMDAASYPLLVAIEALGASTGFLANTAADTPAMRTITGTANLITVTDGDGVAGNPTLTVGSNVVRKDSDNTLASQVSLLHTVYDHGTVVAGAQAVHLTDGAFQVMTLAAGVHSITMPNAGTGHMILEVINGGNVTGPTITGATKQLTGTAVIGAASAIGRVNWLYIWRLTGGRVVTQFMNIV
jgi:hypothetical protein